MKMGLSNSRDNPADPDLTLLTQSAVRLEMSKPVMIDVFIAYHHFLVHVFIFISVQGFVQCSCELFHDCNFSSIPMKSLKYLSIIFCNYCHSDKSPLLALSKSHHQNHNWTVPKIIVIYRYITC